MRERGYASVPDPDVDNWYGGGWQVGGERYTCKGGRVGRSGVHLASLSKLLGMGGGGREAQRGIDLFLKCKFEE